MDTMGAEHLLGMGDMLFVPPGSSKMARIHGAFISEDEISRIVEFLKESLNMNVYRGDPWARVVFAEDLRPVLDEIGPRMAVSIGLAMREID